MTIKVLLRDVVNGTIGFKALASATGLMEKSLMRLLSAKGNLLMFSTRGGVEWLQPLEDIK